MKFMTVVSMAIAFPLCTFGAFSKKVIFIVGPAGSGKTTAAVDYANEHSVYCAHYSVGNLLREQAKNETELGLLIRGILERAEIVPLEIGMKVVESALLSESKEFILIDGFPPTVAYMDAFEDLIKRNSTIEFLGAIAFEINQHIAQERVLGRSRSDDKKENFVKRYNRYLENRDTLFDRFAQYALAIVNGNQSLEIVKQSFARQVSYFIEIKKNK